VNHSGSGDARAESGGVVNRIAPTGAEGGEP
jgi:hypothetical protein